MDRKRKLLSSTWNLFHASLSPKPVAMFAPYIMLEQCTCSHWNETSQPLHQQPNYVPLPYMDNFLWEAQTIPIELFEALKNDLIWSLTLHQLCLLCNPVCGTGNWEVQGGSEPQPTDHLLHPTGEGAPPQGRCWQCYWRLQESSQVRNREESHITSVPGDGGVWWKESTFPSSHAVWVRG